MNYTLMQAGREAVQRIGDARVWQSRGAPWSPVKLMYPMAAGGMR